MLLAHVTFEKYRIFVTNPIKLILTWLHNFCISRDSEKNCTTIRRIWNVFLARVYIPIFHLNHVPTCACAFEKYRIFVRNRIRLILTWSYNFCISRDSNSGKAYSRGLGHTIPRIDRWSCFGQLKECFARTLRYSH